MIQFALFGNRGAYRMPGSPTFATREEAVAHGRLIHGLDNRFIVVRPVMAPAAPYVHTGFEAGAL